MWVGRLSEAYISPININYQEDIKMRRALKLKQIYLWTDKAEICKLPVWGEVKAFIHNVLIRFLSSISKNTGITHLNKATQPNVIWSTKAFSWFNKNSVEVISTKMMFMQISMTTHRLLEYRQLSPAHLLVQTPRQDSSTHSCASKSLQIKTMSTH